MEKIRVAGPYRLSDEEVENGECQNCGRNFVFRQDGRDHMCPLPSKTAPVIGLNIGRDDLHRHWVCNVVRSGYHNGAYCTPSDPHGADWYCGYQTECHISLTDEQMKEWA